jgi:adenosylcobinamide-GDP ribazoletransferase
MRAALAFLTPLPVGRAAPNGRTLAWFPLAGAVIGALVSASWWGAAELFRHLVTGAIVVAVDLLLTGALHVDGLADTADGLLPPLDSAERRKAVMRTPEVGAFGVAAVVAVLLLRWSAFATVDPDAAAVIALWAASRGAMAVALIAVPYVGGGLGSAFLGARWGPVLGWSLLLPVSSAFLADDPVAVLAALGGLAVVAVGVVALARRRLGGVTGDVAGAAGLLAETVGLVVLAATW